MRVGRYTLPDNYISNDKLDGMSKNMKDFVIVDKINRTIKNA